MPQSHGHHHGERQCDPHLHLGLAADKVVFESEAVIDAIVDPFQGVTAVVTAPPGGAAVRRGGEDAPVLLGDLDAHDAPVLPRRNPAGLMALGLASAL